MSFKEEIYFSTFLRNIFLTFPFFLPFRSCRIYPFLTWKVARFVRFSCLILFDIPIFMDLHLQYLFFHSGVLLLLLLADLLLLWSIGRVFQTNNEFVHLTSCGCRLRFLFASIFSGILCLQALGKIRRKLRQTVKTGRCFDVTRDGSQLSL